MPPRLPLLLFVFCLLLSSCAAPVTSSPLPPTATIPPTLLPTETPLPSATATPILPTPVPPERPQYTFDVLMDTYYGTLEVTETIAYPNFTGQTLDNLVLAVEPNVWPGGFTLSNFLIDGKAPAYTLDGHKMTVQLPDPCQPGQTLHLVLAFKLVLPPIPPNLDTSITRPQIYGETANQINLVEWYPFIVPYLQGEGWVLHTPWLVGEYLVYDSADFSMDLRFVDASNPPVIASSGAEEITDTGFRYTLTAGRTFALSMSYIYRYEEQVTGGVTVRSYYFTDHESAGKAALEATIRALEIYGETFGAYPHKSLAIVEGDFEDGMEFSGLYFLGRYYYRTFDKTPKNYLTIIAVHETAHQWWFDRVASDQALEPWLDEALCAYSEHVFYENEYPNLVDWWWAYRVNYFEPEGWVDTIVYDGAGFRPYTNAVYLRGAGFLEAVRLRIGDEAFFAFLKDYAGQFSGRIANSNDFFALLRQHADDDLSDIIGKYFSRPY